MTYWLSNLAGLQFRAAEAKQVVLGLIVGDELTLEREPENPYDENAIRVLKDDEHIGYLEKIANPPIAMAMDEGKTLTCTVADIYLPDDNDTHDKRWMRPMLRIEVGDGGDIE